MSSYYTAIKVPEEKTWLSTLWQYTVSSHLRYVTFFVIGIWNIKAAGDLAVKRRQLMTPPYSYPWNPFLEKMLNALTLFWSGAHLCKAILRQGYLKGMNFYIGLSVQGFFLRQSPRLILCPHSPTRTAGWLCVSAQRSTDEQRPHDVVPGRIFMCLLACIFYLLCTRSWFWKLGLLLNFSFKLGINRRC